ncbi:hypothetical protein [Serratia sp. Se-RSBMAAmG]|uniref:hypothetical protein n=1 Tax=Serratia sp. Se-RSBMAAmG TaxID=3043305 RepID=UPI0024AF864F|nr:hypothetical protein [Serratia sp. Se-RSBMAAmG]MDI6976071.1 hypothetical protein [Serratia sp. Se-RSBMAAmG]
MSNIILDDNWRKRMEKALQHKPVMMYGGCLPEDLETCSAIFCVVKKRENVIKMIEFGEAEAVTKKYEGLKGLRYLITDTQSIADAVPADSAVEVIFLHDDITADKINTILLKEDY